ncbi:MAG: phosphate signaling complex protein PhoU [Candidatus Margulisiibacteriota bacterium]
MAELRESFAQDLKNLESKVIEMAEVVRKMLNGEVAAFRQKNEKALDEVITLDDTVDKYNFEIESRCLELIALQQPMAKDLRTIASIMRMINDLERMGDYSVDVAKFMKRMIKEEALPLSEKVYAIESAVEKMLDETLRAFANRDLALVSEMIKDDDFIDDSFRSLFEEVVATINQKPTLARQAIWLLMVARYLERIADHITNVGERIYYMETGEIKELHV